MKIEKFPSRLSLGPLIKFGVVWSHLESFGLIWSEFVMKITNKKFPRGSIVCGAQLFVGLNYLRGSIICWAQLFVGLNYLWGSAICLEQICNENNPKKISSGLVWGRLEFLGVIWSHLDSFGVNF